jgi:hypothetical protein
MTILWLNRVVAALPASPRTGPDGDALAVDVSVPLLLRGPASVATGRRMGSHLRQRIFMRPSRR